MPGTAMISGPEPTSLYARRPPGTAKMLFIEIPLKADKTI
jgi:hypothetical protein